MFSEKPLSYKWTKSSQDTGPLICQASNLLQSNFDIIKSQMSNWERDWKNQAR